MKLNNKTFITTKTPRRQVSRKFFLVLRQIRFQQSSLFVFLNLVSWCLGGENLLFLAGVARGES